MNDKQTDLKVEHADLKKANKQLQKHSALGYVTPHQRRTGEATAIYAKRNQTVRMAKQKNPNRWRTGKVRFYEALNASIVARPVRRAS